MAFFNVNNVAIKGLSGAVPKNVVSNKDYSLLSEKERKLLIKTTGIEERRLATSGITTSDLGFSAAESLLRDLKWSSDEIDVLIFVSQSPDYYLPATAIILQNRLGISKDAMAFDIGLGCSGYVYGLSVIANLLSSGQMKKGLLIVGDVSSATCAYTDKSTYPLFGDAACVTALQFDENADEMTFSLHSDGKGEDAIKIHDGGIRNLVNEDSLKTKKISEGIERAPLNLALDGMAVFDFSIGVIPGAINDFMTKTNTNPDSYDHFVMHQANKIMNETIRRKTGFSKEQTPYSLADFGNTSSASIPLTLITKTDDSLSDNRSILLAGFGVGLSWGMAKISTKNIVVSKLNEL